MTEPLIVFPDPALAVRDLLRQLLAERTEPEARGAIVSTKDPSKVDGGQLPYVQVRVDGRFRDSRLNGRASVRFVVWHRDEGLTVALAALIEGLLLSAHSPKVRGFSPLTGPLPTGDPDTGAPMAALTLTARLRPAQL